MICIGRNGSGMPLKFPTGWTFGEKNSRVVAVVWMKRTGVRMLKG